MSGTPHCTNTIVHKVTCLTLPSNAKGETEIEIERERKRDQCHEVDLLKKPVVATGSISICMYVCCMIFLLISKKKKLIL